MSLIFIETVGDPIERQVRAWIQAGMWTPATRGRMAEFEKKTKRHSRKLDRADVLMYVARSWFLTPILSILSALPRAAAGRGQSFVTATQSTSTSKGPVHSGTPKKMRAGGFFGK